MLWEYPKTACEFVNIIGCTLLKVKFCVYKPGDSSGNDGTAASTC